MLCKPLRVSPPHPFNYLQLPREPGANVHEVIDLFQEIAEDTFRKHAARSLAQQVHFTQEQAVILVRHFPKLRWRSSNKNTIDIAKRTIITACQRSRYV